MTNISTENDEEAVLKKLSLTRVIWPVLIGLGVTGWLFYTQFDLAAFLKIEWTGRMFAWIGLAFICLIIRHLCYSNRMRLLGGGHFSWRKAIELIFIWEFSAALTPTSKGGPFVMLFVLNKENLSSGKTAAVILYTVICDAIFFTLMFPIFVTFFGPKMIQPEMTTFDTTTQWGYAFFLAYFAMATYGMIFFYFLFIRPKHAARVFDFFKKLPFLRKKAASFDKLSNDFTLAAEELKSRDRSFHIGVALSTLGAWTFKFLLINALIIAFVPETPIDGSTQLFLFGRLAAMFTISAFFVTPGGSGLVESTFGRFLSDFIPAGLGIVVALVWRLMAYYLYLFIGGIIVPNWINLKVKAKKEQQIN
jgi:glycosyltransferase 2 family protein